MSLRDLRVAIVGKHADSDIVHLIEIDNATILGDAIDHLLENAPVRFMTVQGGAPVSEEEGVELIAGITGADLKVIKASRPEAPGGLPAAIIQRAEKFEAVVGMLLPFAGDGGYSEGVMDCLARVLEELKRHRQIERDGLEKERTAAMRTPLPIEGAKAADGESSAGAAAAADPNAAQS